MAALQETGGDGEPPPLWKGTPEEEGRGVDDDDGDDGRKVEGGNSWMLMRNWRKCSCLVLFSSSSWPPHIREPRS